LASDPPKAAEEGSHVALIGEGGFFLNPPVRRTWSPRGRTPVPTGFGRHRRKVSTLAAISVTPGRRRIGRYRKTDPKGHIAAPAVVEFLRGLLRHLEGEAIVARDGGSHPRARPSGRRSSDIPG
jgi:hypothetical protein